MNEKSGPPQEIFISCKDSNHVSKQGLEYYLHKGSVVEGSSTRSEEGLSLSRQKGQKWMKCLPSFSLLSIEVITVIRRPPCLACQHLFDVAGQNVITPPIGKSVRENNPPLQRFVQFKLENTKIQKRAAEKNAQIAPTELHCERVMGLRMKEGDRQRKDHRFRERKGQNEGRKGGNQPVLDAL